MKSVVISLLCVLVASLGVVLCSQPAESQDEQQTSPDHRINSLLAERQDTLRSRVEWFTARQKAGHTSLENVIRAQNELLNAELDIAKTTAERIQIHEKRVKNFCFLEKVLMQQRSDGQATYDEICVAKAARLTAKIELLQDMKHLIK